MNRRARKSVGNEVREAVKDVEKNKEEVDLSDVNQDGEKT